MKVRTCLIVACMTVVPALALFSHRVPGEVRARLRSCLWQPLAAWADSSTEASPDRPRDPAGEPTVSVSQATPAAPAPPRPAPSGGGSFAASVEPLTRLGAVAIDCRPLDGVAGTHVASCRVAVDAAGQLHRVFQAAGTSPEEALASLTAVVQDWQERLAARAANVAGPAARPLR
jgi:hypothetical protein